MRRARGRLQEVKKQWKNNKLSVQKVVAAAYEVVAY